MVPSTPSYKRMAVACGGRLRQLLTVVVFGNSLQQQLTAVATQLSVRH